MDCSVEEFANVDNDLATNVQPTIEDLVGELTNADVDADDVDDDEVSEERQPKVMKTSEANQVFTRLQSHFLALRKSESALSLLSTLREVDETLCLANQRQTTLDNFLK